MMPAYRFGDFTLTASTRELKRGDAPVAISPRAFDCLAYLLEHRDRAVGKDELVAAVWERVDVSDTQLGQTVLRARRAVNDDGQAQNVIKTVSRFGYRWVADVALVSDRDNAPTEHATAEAPQSQIAPTQIAPTPPRTHRLLTRIAAMLAIAAVVIGAAIVWTPRTWLSRMPTLSTAPYGSAVVLPMHVASESTDTWLRLGAMDLVAERLRAGGLAVPPSENTVAVLQNLPDGGDATTAVRRVAPNALIVDGDIAQTGNAWHVSLRAVADDGTTLTAESAKDDALGATREAVARLLGHLGRSRPPEPPYAAGVGERLARAEAAMLSNDLDAARAILVSDPALAHAEPELGYRLAMIDFRAGEYARAEAAYTSLLAEPATNDPANAGFHARVLDGRGAVRIRQDNYTGAEQDYDAALALLADRNDAAETGRALTGRGVSRSMRRDFAEALADLGQARVQLEEAGDPLAIARVDTDQAALEMNRDRPQAALGYLESGAAVFERYGAINELMETLESIVSNHIVLLQPAEALAASDRSWALVPRVTDPNQRLSLVEDRVEAFLLLGRFGDAGALLSTLPADANGANAFVARRLPALRARLALAQGDPANAAAEAKRALALPAPSDDLGEGVAEIALVYQRAMLTQSKPDQPPAAAWIDFGKPEYPVQALAIAEWAASRDDASAKSAYERALSMAEARGQPYDVGSVTASFGPWLIAHGELREAGDVIGRVAPWAAQDYDSALLQVRLFHALGQPGPWSKAIAEARSLAGERTIPGDVRDPPRAGEVAAAAR
jgi:DNA-binding winged helix-turn-helix (wHTH) protein/tetratricopeptide (TPR) repeat protein